MQIDPVCGMEVEGEDFKTEHKGVDYFFCTEDCKNEFETCPEDYVGEEQLPN